LISGLYLLFVALTAFGLGGYIAGRMRVPLNLAALEMEFRDGMHGLITWGLAVILTAMFALVTAGVATLAVVPSGSGPLSQSVAGESTIALELDELFHSDRNIPNLFYRRAEAARILLKSPSSRGVPSEDRAYLATVVASSVGIPLEAAQDRVNREIAASARDLHKARVAAVLQAFFIAVALLAGAAVAWFSACEGGRDRERGSFPVWDWSLRRR
jgi:hypothetical protein